MTGTVDQLFAQASRIPSVPEVVSKLIKELNLPNTNFREITDQVSHDQAIAIKVLRLANSAYYGLPRKLTAIDEAVMTLGVDRMKTLIIASGMVATVPQMQGFDLKAFWANSFRRATYAKGIAALVPGLDVNTAFTCGLISDFGRLMLRMADPTASEGINSAVMEGGKNRSDVERAQLGYTTAEVAGELCKRWGFPAVMQKSLTQSAEPLAFSEFDAVAACVFLADALCNMKAKDLSAHDIPSALPGAVLEKLALGEADIQKIAFRIYDSESGLEALAA